MKQNSEQIGQIQEVKLFKYNRVFYYDKREKKNDEKRDLLPETVINKN